MVMSLTISYDILIVFQLLYLLFFQVISVTKLRKNYKSFQDKRTLCSQYDAFLCDERIYHLIPKAVGKAFFSRKKYVCFALVQGFEFFIEF